MAQAKKAAKKPSAKGAVFDIAPPAAGSINASSTSRPVIIKHPHMPDPMVNDTPREDLPPPAAPVKAAKKVVITPLHQDVTTGQDVVKTAPRLQGGATETVEQPQIADVLPPRDEPAPTPAVLVEDPQLKDEPPAPPKPAPVPNRQISDMVPNDKLLAADAKAAADNRTATLQHLMENETYFLPIVTVEERRSKRVALIGTLLIILLAVAWYDVALDAGLAPNTYHVPHTALFSVRAN